MMACKNTEERRVMGKVSASLMCADLMNLEKEIRELEQCNVDYLHLDVMDGNFVPNITLGLEVVRSISEVSDIPRDIHLLVNHPERYPEKLELKQSDIVTFHFESAVGVYDTMDKVKNLNLVIDTYKKWGCKVGLVINPETPISVIEPFVNKLDLVNIMMIHPGFAGLPIINGIMDKISDMREFLDKREAEHIAIEVDGNVSFEHARIMKTNGGDIFVAGTSSLFKKDMSKKEAITRLRQSIL